MLGTIKRESREVRHKCANCGHKKARIVGTAEGGAVELECLFCGHAIDVSPISCESVWIAASLITERRQAQDKGSLNFG